MFIHRAYTEIHCCPHLRTQVVHRSARVRSGVSARTSAPRSQPRWRTARQGRNVNVGEPRGVPVPLPATLPPTAVPPNRFAQDLFAPLPGRYDALAEVLSFGQNGRWRRAMVAKIDPAPGGIVLDVASGTAGVAIALAVGRAEQLPFPDACFDGLTFTYLLRYVEDPAATLVELARVVKPGGTV